MDLVDVADLVPANGATWRDGDAFLAGGSWLFSEPQPGLARLLDLQSFGWPALVDRTDGSLEIAATCTLDELSRRPEPLFGQCCDALLGSFKVWNTATVGGNVCLALPAGPMTSLSAALDGVAELWSGEQVRHVPVAEFVLGPRRTDLRPGELLRSITLPAHALRARHAFRQISLSPYGRSAVLVVGRVDVDGRAVLTVTASTPRPVQFRFDAPPSPDEAADAVARITQWHDDVHGHPRWRAAMTRLLATEVAAELAP